MKKINLYMFVALFAGLSCLDASDNSAEIHKRLKELCTDKNNLACSAYFNGLSDGFRLGITATVEHLQKSAASKTATKPAAQQRRSYDPATPNSYDDCN